MAGAVPHDQNIYGESSNLIGEVLFSLRAPRQRGLIDGPATGVINAPSSLLPQTSLANAAAAAGSSRRCRRGAGQRGLNKACKEPPKAAGMSQKCGRGLGPPRSSSITAAGHVNGFLGRTDGRIHQEVM